MFGIYAVGHISGAHFNAAVTFAFALTRHFPWPRALAYWGAQFVGALCAAALLRASLGNIAHVGATLPSGSEGQAFLWELVMSAFLMFVILAVATDTRAVGEAAAIAIGGTIGLDAMFGGPITGASMNPIRSLAPALVSGDLHALWVYLIAPVVGASLGGLAYQFVRGEQTRPADRPRWTPPRRQAQMNVLFVCVANSGRSVIAERLFRRAAQGRHQARSAGSEPGTAPHPQVVEALTRDRDRRERPRAAQARPGSARVGRRRGLDLQRGGLSGHAGRAPDQLGVRGPEEPAARAGAADPGRDRAQRRAARRRARPGSDGR